MIQEQSRERRAVRRIVVQQAASAGMPVYAWLESHGINRKVVTGTGRPTLETVYRVCGAAGIKVSEFFERLGL